LFNIFIYDFINFIIESNVNVPIIGKTSVSVLLFAGDLAIGSLTVNGLQKGIDQVVK
jgi:hypothetical protein